MSQYHLITNVRPHFSTMKYFNDSSLSLSLFWMIPFWFSSWVVWGLVSRSWQVPSLNHSLPSNPWVTGFPREKLSGGGHPPQFLLDTWFSAYSYFCNARISENPYWHSTELQSKWEHNQSQTLIKLNTFTLYLFYPKYKAVRFTEMYKVRSLPSRTLLFRIRNKRNTTYIR